MTSDLSAVPGGREDDRAGASQPAARASVLMMGTVPVMWSSIARRAAALVAVTERADDESSQLLARITRKQLTASCLPQACRLALVVWSPSWGGLNISQRWLPRAYDGLSCR